MENKFPSREELRKSHIDETGFDRDVQASVVEKQKTYTWMRLYLNEELDIKPGETVTMKYTSGRDEMDIDFGSYNKKNLHKDLDDEVVSYEDEDDKKCLCLMIDVEDVNSRKDIPFLRTLFKEGRYFDSNNLLIKEGEIVFIYDGEELGYYSVDF